ncbi:MAG TPA: serine/threonine protein kinase, partial [Anaerolineae bacterium]|nr:serine/threonine protein kinase [Anaerolineae bacterium]
MQLSTGQIVNNRYRIARLLGQGGMGAVYRAWDLTLNIPVALKEMLPDPSLSPQELAQLRQQFQQEALALAGLMHPNLPRVTDFFEWEGRDYLV